MLKQLGQAMVEYTIVTAAFVTGLLVLNSGACPNQYEDCIEYLLTVMHDNSDGYSNSITAVQDYGKSFKPAGGPVWPGEGDPNGDDSGGGGSPGEIGDDGIVQSTQLTSADGVHSYGVLDGGNVLDANGNLVGTYNSDTGVFTPVVGAIVVGVVEKKIVKDEAGNILQMQAVVDCGTGEVRGFGYRSKASGKFVNSLNLSELNVSGYCFAPSYEVISQDGSLDGGRIVNGQYYAVSITAAITPTAPTGEVIYWSELGACTVMVSGWDAGLDPDLSDEDRYAEQLVLYFEPDTNVNPRLGRMNSADYVEQTFLYNQPPWPNDCVSARTLP